MIWRWGCHVRERAVERAAFAAAADPVVTSERRPLLWERLIKRNFAGGIFVGAAIFIRISQAAGRLSIAEPSPLDGAVFITAIPGKSVPIVAFFS